MAEYLYRILTVVVLVVECYLALYVRDDFFRPFVGDLLVVVLIYCALRSFWKNQSKNLVLGVCLFAFGVEFVQYFDPVGYFGWQSYQVLSVLIGRTFSVPDLVAYSAGSIVNFIILRYELSVACQP